ncbi:DUF6197 family protein [Kitasatospora mediocidica]|uniref:DUF6197 family protein n=1 Tax=Kitasatospora mediocidica TaxID=58352 RepID=UPI000566B9A4|nr:hypothetical protein [Kitasatospora mediocidica]
MTDIDIPAALDKAADFIEIPGNFGKGRFKQGGCYCTLGAFALALGVECLIDDDAVTALDSETYWAHSGAFSRGWEELSKTAMSVANVNAVQTMNDRPETTAEQMAGVLRETAERLRRESA